MSTIPSILRAKNQSSSKGNVSFSDNPQIESFEPRHPDPFEEQYQNVNDDDDAFDPQLNNESANELKSIRDVRSKRALERLVGIDEFENDPDSRKKSIRDGFDGEELTDDRYSLLHDKDTNKEDFPIEPFNMKSEREDGEGYFDGETYIFRRNEEEEDAWLDDLESSKSNYTDSVSLDINPKRRQLTLVNTQNDNLSKEDIYRQLIELLGTDNETVIQALGRLGAIIKREKKKNEQNSNIESEAKKSLERLTELSNVLMMKFEDNLIYEKCRKEMSKSINTKRTNVFSNENDIHHPFSDVKKRKGGDGNPMRPAMWCYKGNQDDEIHGPYTSKQMLDWISAGYFVGSMAVDVYKVDDSGLKPSNSKTDLDDLLDDLEDNEDDDATKKAINIEWLRSDKVDFKSYI